MEILSINFAIFVIKLAFCVVPIAFGVRLITFSSEIKEETMRKLSEKLLGEPNLVERGVFNFGLYFIASIFILFGSIVFIIMFL
tara:strand:+ start:157 stop:408 length:252 start_codon:yes stop_codon:yes gene_type:complete